MHIKSTNIYGFITYFFHLGMNVWISSSSYDWTRNVAVGSIICAMNIYTELHSAPVLYSRYEQAGTNQWMAFHTSEDFYFIIVAFFYYFDKDMHKTTHIQEMNEYWLHL